jgi:hypothetical protein
MDAAQEGLSPEDNGSLQGEENASQGMPADEMQQGEGQEASEGQNTNDPLFVQKRLKQQKRAHEREIRALHAKIEAMQSNGPKDEHYPDQSINPYEAPQGGDMAEHIHRAVNQVLAHKEMQEQKVKQAQEAQHINKQYQDLHNHLDNVSDKYDDFDDVVRGSDLPFTSHMRDASLLLPQTGPGSAGEVLYKLGKNREELNRISKLHPIEQARELNKLSHALANGGERHSSAPRSMGNIKSNPVNNSHAITDKTSASEIRARMKAGKFK